VNYNPQGRLIDPSEVLDAAVWLCSEGADPLTGQATVVIGLISDGGRSAIPLDAETQAKSLRSMEQLCGCSTLTPVIVVHHAGVPVLESGTK
jgi:hypothetical protein